MNRAVLHFAAAGALALVSVSAAALDYPAAPRGDVVDNYHGTRVADPYRWLEDVDSPATRAWVKAEQALTDGYLATLKQRDALRTSLATLWNFEKFGLPKRVGEDYVYLYNDGLRDQPLLVRQPAAGGDRQVLLDPNTLSADGTVALSEWEVSPDGRFLAYGTAEAGSDWNTFHVRDLSTGQDLDETLEHIKFSGISWTADSAGFYYSRFPGSDGVFDELSHQQLHYHRLRTAQAADVLVEQDDAHPQWGFYGEVADGGRYLYIRVSEGATDDNALYVRDLRDPRAPRVAGRRVKVEMAMDARFEPIGQVGDTLLVWTTDGAPRGKIVAVDLTRPAQRRVVVPESDDTIEIADVIGGRIVIAAMHDAAHRVRLYTTDGKPAGEVALPGLGSVSALGGKHDGDEILLQFESPLMPERIIAASATSGAARTVYAPALDFDVDDLVTEQVFYRSKDGTRIPMFITRRADAKPDGTHPTYLYGYGGFNISLTPFFSVSNLVWVKRGGILAIPNLRGGGEYGEEWHRAGTKLHKQNVFDDFIAAAEYLVDQDWTSPEHLAVGGGSNGGLLVGAVVNQRPELFAAAVPAVGVMDMLRFHKFTIGWAWTGDYGSSDDPAEFKALYAYSPYHNVRSGVNYPAILVMTADHDDRVVPGHSFKCAAALQHADTGPAPKLIRIESRAGHGRGKPTSKRIEEAADRLAFIAQHTGLSLSSHVPWGRLVPSGR